MEPYPYQDNCLNTLAKVREDGKNCALVVLASGLGKTVVAALDALQHTDRHPGKILYLCHQKDILEQAEAIFKDVLPRQVTYGYYHSREKHRNVGCLLATFQTMEGHLDQFDPREFAYIVVDESHHGHAPTYRPTIDHFRPDFMLALTATPDRTDLKDIRSIYGQEVFSLPLEDALAEGLLTEVKYLLMNDELQNLKFLDTPIGKISIAELNRKLFVPKRDKEIARIIKEQIAEIPDARVMIFCPSITYCNRLVKYLPKAVAIHSDLTLGLQNQRLDAFKCGKDNIVLTVDKFNEGIDVPEANIIVFLRSTSSRTIFLQQLGRGLRKIRGKKKVLVMDFIGNCERLEMVNQLWQSVQEKQKVTAPKQDGKPSDSPITINYSTITFTEEVKKVLDVIAQIRTGYTREILANQLHNLGRELGKTPTHRDVFRGSKQGKCAAPQTFISTFGTFNDALKAAKFKPNVEHRGKDEMVRQLQALADKLGRAPTKADVNTASKAGTIATSNTYVTKFGSWQRALRAGKIKKVGGRRGLRGNRHFAPNYLRSKLKELERELKRIPTPTDISEKRKTSPDFPSESSFRSVFGTFAQALRDAGFIEPTIIKLPAWRGTNQELLDQLKMLAHELGKRPTAKEVQAASRKGKCRGEAKFREVFGSLKNALDAAGL